MNYEALRPEKGRASYNKFLSQPLPTKDRIPYVFAVTTRPDISFGVTSRLSYFLTNPGSTPR
jgi:hypothetical protein